MNLTHLHLLITHLPIFGSVLGGLVLAYGIWSKSNQTKIAAYLLLILSSFGGVVAYFTGEEAEEFVEHLPGFSETIIGQHEDSATFALVGVIVLGLFSVIGMFYTLKQSTYTKTLAQVVLLVSLITFGFVARTGYLGGQIRHTELNSSATNVNQGGEQEDDD